MNINYYERPARARNNNMIKCAEWNGVEFCWKSEEYIINSKNEIYNIGKFLHTAVWEYYNGEVTKGYVIHHIDGDHLNNIIENLTMITRREHWIIHNVLTKVGVKISQEHKDNISKANLGKKRNVKSNNISWKPVTEEMLEDIKSNITQKQFVEKYGVSIYMYRKALKQLNGGI